MPGHSRKMLPIAILSGEFTKHFRGSRKFVVTRLANWYLPRTPHLSHRTNPVP
jgi:hypothetical protein